MFLLNHIKASHPNIFSLCTIKKKAAARQRHYYWMAQSHVMLKLIKHDMAVKLWF